VKNKAMIDGKRDAAGEARPVDLLSKCTIERIKEWPVQAEADAKQSPK
jgi:hypothetical protein